MTYVELPVTDPLGAVLIPFPYLSPDDVKVTVPANYAGMVSIDKASKEVIFTPKITSGPIIIKRVTQRTPKHVFANLMRFNFATVDENFTQMAYINEELADTVARLTGGA